MIKAIIFDLDGVLIDSERLWTKMSDIYYQRHGIMLSPSLRKYMERRFRGAAQLPFVRFIKERFDIKDSLATIHRDRMKILIKLFSKSLKPVPYAQATVKRLAKKYPVALVSSSPRVAVTFSVRKFHLRGYLTEIISGDDVKEAKPNPSIFLKAAIKMKVKPEHCLVIEDSHAGIKAAKRARMKRVLLKTPYTTKEQMNDATITIKKLSELSMRAIERLN